MKQYLLCDLDGTLTDPKVGICTCVQYALASFGIEEPDLDKLEPFIGPPLKNSFMNYYHLTEEQAEETAEPEAEAETAAPVTDSEHVEKILNTGSFDPVIPKTAPAELKFGKNN